MMTGFYNLKSNFIEKASISRLTKPKTSALLMLDFDYGQSQIISSQREMRLSRILLAAGNIRRL